MRCALSLLLPFLLAGCPTPSGPDASSNASDGRGDSTPDAADTVDVSTGTDAFDAPAPVPVMVTTDRGPVVGRTVGTVSVFRGIPYAAAPTGPRRWQPPAPRDPWTTPLDVSSAPLPCPQLPSGLSTTPIASSEDCLNVNVWTANPSASASQPVMVFIHGGGFTAGDPSNPLFDGTQLAQHGVVLVTVGYRLGQLGFLAHPALVAEDSAHHSAGNYGLLDQQAALAWVQRNVAVFGGDPHNVTLFGESAGAISVCAHVVSPLATGLFHRVIGESGSCVFFQTPLATTPGNPFESAEALGQRFASALSCDTASDVLACLRSKSVDDVLHAVPTQLEDLTILHAHFMPNIDGYVLPASPWNTLIAGGGNPVDYVIGGNADEGTGFTLGHELMSQSDFDTAVGNIVPHHVSEVDTLYPASAYPTINDAFNAFLGDALFLCPARRVASAMSAVDPHAYLYEFTRVNNFGRTLHLGAFHGTELPYVFGNFVSPFTETMADTALSQTVMQYWVDFARGGDPNGSSLPTWPAYTPTADPYIDLGDTVTARVGLRADKCAMLDGFVSNP